MLNTLAICASLGFGIFVSPEILIIGLLLASDRSHPRANTLGYFLGSADPRRPGAAAIAP